MNSEAAHIPWQEENQRLLTAELAVIREMLRCRRGREPEAHATPDEVEAARPAHPELDAARATLPAGGALDHLCALFGLSQFERAVLLLCAGIELDASLAQECAAAQGDRQRTYPTFSLALAALPEPHWSALTPEAPLRYWRLVETAPGPVMTTSPLRIDERILHFLAGAAGMDERLAGYVEPVAPSGAMAPTHEAMADRIAAQWSRAAGRGLPVVQLCGIDAAGKRDVAAAACARLGLELFAASADRLPQAAAELEVLQRLWDREAALGGRALLLDCGPDAGDARNDRPVRQWVERARGPLLVAAAEPVRGILRSRVNFEIRKPTAGEQRRLWERALGPAAAAMNGQLDRLTSQFDLGAAAIRTVCEGAGRLAEDEAGPDPAVVWDACRAQSRVRLDDLAQRIESRVTWEDLVLPDRTSALLREVAVHVRQRARVYETWGFAEKSSRGLGVSAMFCGPSGTGKTLAAEVLANELRLDLYRIDLSQVVSKYIGETEKNLRRVFDAAEEGGAVLLFDEADALFGKRSEVRDSHDRHANIEVSYLLQRMEAYRGLAVLTTNMKDALDPAFLRRIRFVVQFPFPDAALRSQIWRRAFPDATPTERLDVKRLSRLNVAGGNIRNVAMNAAFLAAEAGEAVGMRHLSRAARAEFAKLEKPLSDAELEGWE